MNTYLALVHHPIRNKIGEVVTTSVTNLDIHDISRSCRTFGIKKYFLVTPLPLQKDLVHEILDHWKTDTANAFNPDRQDALSIAEALDSVEDTISRVEALEGQKPIVVVTGANFKEYNGSVQNLKDFAAKEGRSVLLLFGTGWGLHQKILDMAEFKLSPIVSLNSDGYNHLSVRSAVAIYLDRFFGM